MRNRRAGVCAVLTAVSVLSLLAPGPPAAAALGCPTAAAGVAAPGIAAADTAAALALARSCQRPVEDLSRRTAVSESRANPDGTATVTQFFEPRWVRRGRGWAAVDTTLRFTGGAVTPVATVLPVSFSAGGTAPLARIGDGDHELAMSWPAPLPVPTLDGASAVYAEVYPGVDLRVTATVRGFSEVLVVKTRAALKNPALRSLPFGLTTRNVTVATVAGGGAVARNQRGEVVFTSPTPVMWDSSGQDPVGPTGRGAPAATGNIRLAPRTAPMATRLAAGRLTVVPDRTLMDDPDMRLPVYIDPSWSGAVVSPGWKVVADRPDVINSSTFALLEGAAKGNGGAGRVCDSVTNGSCTSPEYRVRTFLTMDVSGAQNRHVLRSTLTITQKWAWTCNPASNAKLWLTGGISSGTSWANQPFWDGHTVEAAASHKLNATSGCSGPGTVEFDTTGIITFALSLGWGPITMGLRAINENSVLQWKRFDVATAAQSIVYNTFPNVPDTFATGGQAGCVTGGARPVVGVTNPTLSARVTDPDGAGEGDIGGTLRGEFAWQRWDAPTSTWVDVASGLGTPQAGGTTSPAPAPSFGAGIFRWHVRAADSWSLAGVGSGTDSSAFGPWCEFEVDPVRPNPAVLTPHSANAPFAAGKTVRLALSPGGSPADADITGYEWFVVDGGGTHATTFAPGQTATIDWTPIAGQGTVRVRAKDRIQTSLTEATYAFNAAQSATEVARWPLAEPAGSTTAGDITGHGNDATVAFTAPAALGRPGRIVNGATAASFDGVSGNNITTAGPVLDASRSFTVSAWAKLADKSATHVVLSQFGTLTGANSGFTLEYTAGPGEDRWEMLTFGADGNGTGRVRSTVVPSVGVWTHLTGVYDSAARTIRLFVGGVAPSSQSAIVGVNGGGTMRIGRAIGQPFAGSVSDVRVWDRVLSTTEIADLVDPTSQENVATDNVGQWLVEPGTCFGSPVTCLDSSAYAHDITLSGDVAPTPAGQSGSGLLYGPAHGIARTTDPNTGLAGPALYTDQSFTVSAWVKLAVMPTGNRTALGQEGSRVSAFFLGASKTATADGLPHWTMSMPGSDEPGAPGWRNAVAPTALTAADVGVWFHLVGVYDAVRQTITLYVNGTQAAVTNRVTAPWAAAGALTIGGALWHVPPNVPGIEDWWNGSIDTVLVFAGAVPAASINRIP
jgi:hypothetical protein